MTVSAIRQSAPGRLTVSFAEGGETETTPGVVADLRLYAGRELDGEAMERFRLGSVRALARERAISLVSRRQMSRAELRKKLLEKGIDEDTADFCVDWMEENRLIDDESYAAAVARHYYSKGCGAGRIRQELSRRGISRELCSAVAESVPAGNPKMDKYIASRLTDPEDREQIRKISAALYRRGFSWEEIRGALERFGADCGE